MKGFIFKHFRDKTLVPAVLKNDTYSYYDSKNVVKNEKFSHNDYFKVNGVIVLSPVDIEFSLRDLILSSSEERRRRAIDILMTPFESYQIY